ncbi:MAG: NF038122 family metalloprotease [Cyanobacteria bacterium P01_D01_bin.105]
MVQFNFTYDPSISLEQRVGFELAAMIWSSYLTDDVEVNLHIASSASLGQDGQAVGGAIPILHEQNYGIYQEYADEDADSDIDEEVVEHLQDGNTVDVLVDGQVVDGNTNILLTSAQAKALGMDEALDLDGSGTWDRDLVDPNALDGYILVSNAFDWNYDYTRSGEAPPGTLDFMSMAMHEIGHQLGFVSGLDGALELSELYSGETQAEGITVLDLFRHSDASGEIANPDGAVSDLTLGQNSYFSVDGGETNLGNFSNGANYQASHWERLQMAMGIMDPTLAYQERTSLSLLDLQALDALGWDVDYDALEDDLDLDKLLKKAEKEVAKDLGLDSKALTETRAGDDGSIFYTLGYGELWQIFEQSMFELGYGELWSVFELGYGELWQEYGDDLYELGYGELWQMIEDNIFNLGYGELWQQFETEMYELGYGELWQQFESEMLELGYGELWQQLDTFFITAENKGEHKGNSHKDEKQADGGVGGQGARTFYAGSDDDIIAGDRKQDRIKAGAGDDLIDGKAGHDVIWGEAGRDMIYGHDGNDLLYGGEDDDLLLGENDDDELHGEAGHDILSGGRGDDILSGDDGRDNLKGGSGNDVLAGGEGDDRLMGEADSDILIGDEGRDQLMGGSGNDVIYGDAYEGIEPEGVETEGEVTLRQLRTQLQAQSGEGTEDTSPASPSYGPIRVEAESMNLTGDAFIHRNWSNDSGDSVKTDGTSTSRTTFSGQSGSYMVVVRYFDEVGGDGKLDFALNGTSLNSFDLNQETDRYYTRTIAQNITLNSGDEFIVTATGDGKDHAAFDYIEFIPLDSLIETPLEQVSSGNSVSTTSANSGQEGVTTLATAATTGDIFRVEAESMSLVGDYYTESNSTASGGSVIAVSNQGEGKALSVFSGEAGYYNIVVGYYDENDDGIAQISAALNNAELDSWSLDQRLGSSSANTQTLTARTVASTVFLKDGDILELAGRRGESSGSDELARIDYVDFVKVDLTSDVTNSEAASESVVVNSEPVILGSPIRIEAESMHLNGYSLQSRNNTSGGQIIRTGSAGIATTEFSGESGYYNIVVAYYDENDGLGRISASLEGVELDDWQLDQNLGSASVNDKTFVTRTIATQIQVNAGDELRLEGLRDAGERARIDYVEFVPVSAPVLPVNETINDDFIQAGEGNDTVYGGEGNDIIYGNEQGDTSSSLLRGAQAYNGNTYLLSNVGSWEEAQAEARSLGGNLVTINDAVEEAWLHDSFGTAGELWIGLTDQAVEGQFEWVNGEAVTYTNWSPNEPNDHGLGEDYAIFNRSGSQQWDDRGQPGQIYQGVIEINTTDNDTLFGGGGNDTLYGNGGDDVLYGDDQLSSSGSTLPSSLSDGLVGHWALDETTGTRAQNAAGGNEGILGSFSDSGWTSGAVGGALNFSGTAGDTVVVADYDELDITQDLTLTTWVKADSFENWDGLITKGTSQIPYGLSVMASGKLLLQTNYGYGHGGQVYSSDASLTLGEWQHVAVTYDGSSVRFYIDGQLDSSHTANITFETNNQALFLGVDATANAYLDGALDDARVYDRALRAEEIGQLATGEVGSAGAAPTGAEGNDFLYGGIGSDTLEGGGGNDVLEGSDAIAAGYLEQDLLSGGLGSDTFILGNTDQAYYLGGGTQDYALITDFDASEDIVQLHGSASDYSKQQQGSDTYLFYQGGSSEVVAIFENTNSAELNARLVFV